MKKLVFLLIILLSYGCIKKEKRFTVLWPEKNLDFYLGRWNEIEGNEILCMVPLNGGVPVTEEDNEDTICIFENKPGYSFIPFVKRKIKIKLHQKIERKTAKEKTIYYTWSSPYWFRIMLKKELPILRKKPGNEEEFILKGELEKYIPEEGACSIIDREYLEYDKPCPILYKYNNALKAVIERREGKKVKKEVRARIRYMKIDGVCWELYEILDKGEPTFIMGQKTSPSRCNCVPEVCRLMSKVEIKLKKSHRSTKLRRWNFLNNKELKLQAKMGVGKVMVNITYPPLGEEEEKLQKAWRAMWEDCQERLRSGEIKADFSPERSIMRDILMEIEMEKEGGRMEKALIYLYQLGSPKGGKRLTWFDWSQVIEGEGEIELCNGDVAPALMFEDKNCGKTSMEFCLKTEEDIKSIRITKIRATNYAGEVWEESLNLSTRVDGGER